MDLNHNLFIFVNLIFIYILWDVILMDSAKKEIYDNQLADISLFNQKLQNACLMKGICSREEIRVYLGYSKENE
jgi:hypothetical protein